MDLWQTSGPMRTCWLGRTLSLVAAALLGGAGLVYAASEGEVEGDDPWLRIRPVFGEIGTHLVEPGQTLHDVAYDNRLGFEAIQRLNPGIDPWLPMPGTLVRLPTRYVLPATAQEDLVINVPEMRLYDFTKPGPPQVLALAVGDAEDPTPIARFRIGQKRVDPFWRVPASIREEKPFLPALVPPGEENPLGSRWMTLGNTSYGIHGTNVRWSIGRGSTHGCIRLYEDQMQALYDRIETGTPVTIVYEPYKWGTNGRDLFLEAHPDPYGRLDEKLAAALALPRQLELLPRLDLERVWTAVEEARGIPVRVGTLR